MYSFSYLEPVCCSMSSSNCCFLTCIRICQEAGQVVWYSHLFQDFPQFIVIHTVKGFGIVNKAEIDIFLKLSCFFDDPVDVGNLSIQFSSVAQSCPTLCHPTDYSPPGSSVHGILQARILEWVCMSSWRGSSQPRDQTHVLYVSCIGRQVLYHSHYLGSPIITIREDNHNTVKLFIYFIWFTSSDIM